LPGEDRNESRCDAEIPHPINLLGDYLVSKDDKLVWYLAIILMIPVPLWVKWSSSRILTSCKPAGRDRHERLTFVQSDLPGRLHHRRSGIRLGHFWPASHGTEGKCRLVQGVVAGPLDRECDLPALADDRCLDVR